MRFAVGHTTRAVVCALLALAATGCASFRHHGKANKPHCPEPAVSEDVKNMPPLRVPAGLDAPDTRNAVKVPPLTEPQLARAPDAPCLSAPPSFGAPLAPYTGPSSPRTRGAFSWHVNGGGALTMGNSKDYLSTGWTLGGGVSYGRPQSRFSLQLDLGYADFNATHKLINLGQQKVQYSIDGGTGSVWLLNASGRYKVPLTRNVTGYGLLGVGAYHEAIQLTESAIVGNIICDPWGFCYPVATDGVVVQASKNLTKFGWSVGLGLDFGFASNGRSSWFVESRYHSVQGTHSVQFLPLQIGYRF